MIRVERALWSIVIVVGAQGCLLHIDDSLADADHALVGYWKLDEGDGASALDSSGRGNTGTIEGAPQWTDGFDGGGLAFDGVTNQYVDLGNPLDLRIMGSMTVSAWLKRGALSGNDGPIVSKRGFDERGWQLYLEPDGRLVFDVALDAQSYVYRDSVIIPDEGAWVHVVGVYDAVARTLDVYADGQLVNGSLGVVPATAPSSMPPASQYDAQLDVTIGRGAGRTDFVFSGTIDEVRIYGAALSLAAVAAIP